MSEIELRDLDRARAYVVQGLWLQRVAPAAEPSVRPVLEWALELASGGSPLPPVGFVADLGQTLFAAAPPDRAGREPLAVPGLPAGLLRTYEDQVLGKAYADFTLERAGDALRRYRDRRDRARGLVFVVNQFRARAGFGGAHLSPAVLKSLLKDPPAHVLAEGWELLGREGVMPEIVAQYEELTRAARRTPEVLGPEDVFELEHGTALDELGQRVALRQVLHAAARLDDALPRHRPSPRAGRREVPTRVLDEDTYPVGGFSSLTTRGTVESLLHSQLAFMEKEDRPDLFDVKFLRDELLYYSRDENTFLRRRRAFVFFLAHDLTAARYKDAELPWQRGVLLLGLLVTAVRRLSEWLLTDALTFAILLPAAGQDRPLAPERRLLETVFREQIGNGTVVLREVASPDEAAAICREYARRHLCHALAASASGAVFEAEGALVSGLRVDAARPALALPSEGFEAPAADAPFDSWALALQTVLEDWV